MFKNILKTFEAEILEIFKNIQPRPKNKAFLQKKIVTNSVPVVIKTLVLIEVKP